MKTTMTLFATGAVLIATACGSHETPPVQGVTTTGAGVVANNDAISRITEAKCARARDCNELGQDKDYTDMDGCRRKVAHDETEDLKPGECPRGIKEEKLLSCLQEIKSGSCGNVIKSISRGRTCRTSALCLD
jgi:hypothetical protein